MLIVPPPDIDLCSFDWVIVVGESGHKQRTMHEAWVLVIKWQCEVYGTNFFFEQ